MIYMIKGLFTLLCLVGSLLPPLAREASAAPVSVTITKVKCIDDCRNTGLEGAGQSAADFYAKIWINGVQSSTPQGPEDQEEIEPFWTTSAIVPDSQPSFPVAIQIWDRDGTLFGGDDDLGDTSPVDGKNNLEFTVDRVTGRWSGDINWPQSCASGGGNDQPKLQVCFDVGVVSQVGDADGDGLLDGWEKNGLDADGNGSIDVDLPAWGANPLHKDLFLELDSEAGQAPGRGGIQAMKRAFANAPLQNPDGFFGVNLRVDTGTLFDPAANEAGPAPNCHDGLDNDGNGLRDGADPGCVGGAGANLRYLDAATEGSPPGNCNDGIDNDGDGAIDGADVHCLVGDNLAGGTTIPTVNACQLDNAFYLAKQVRFSPLRRWVFRYAISAARPGAPTCTGTSGGQGEIGGNDFVEFNHDGGTVMHELGHTLNLQHGGNEPTNCKPNYISVMNYDNQLGINRVGGGLILDYSPPRAIIGSNSPLQRGQTHLSTLVESALNENNVLDTSDLGNRFVFSIAPGNVVQTSLNANPNWNNDVDPPLEPSVAANINNGAQPGCANTMTNETLNGFHDWNQISLPFRQFGDSADSAVNPGPIEEPTLQQLREHHDTLHRTDLTVTVADAPDPVAAGTPLTYTVTAQNRGPNPASSVQLVNTLPAEVTLVAAPAGCSSAGQVVTCNLGELVAGGQALVTIVANVPPNLVYDHGSPLTINNRAEVRNLTGQEANLADNVASEPTRIVAVADLAMITFTVPNPPIEMCVSESAVVGLHSEIGSNGPSSPMDTHLNLTATASIGAAVTPTQLTTSQPHLTTGEARPIYDHVTIRCDRPGTHTFKLRHRIRPARADDTDPYPANDEIGKSFDVECTGAKEVTINIAPGRSPNTIFPGDQELPVGIMTTRDGEYGRSAFDAADVIRESVRFGPPAIINNKKLGVPAFDGRGTMTDVVEPIPPEVKTDNDLDLLMAFDPTKAGLKSAEMGACVIGLYKDKSGQTHSFYGCDSIDSQVVTQNPPSSKGDTTKPGVLEWLLLIGVLILLLAIVLWPHRLQLGKTTR